MIILVVLIILLVVGIYLDTVYEFALWPILIAVISGAYLVIHILFWSLASYDYGLFMAKRNAIEETVKESRQSKNEYEIAAAAIMLSDWNEKLAERKYNNKTWLLGDYIDDRFELVEPIK